VAVRVSFHVIARLRAPASHLILTELLLQLMLQKAINDGPEEVAAASTYHRHTSKGNDWEDVGDHIDWNRVMSKGGGLFQKAKEP